MVPRVTGNPPSANSLFHHISTMIKYQTQTTGQPEQNYERGGGESRRVAVMPVPGSRFF